jgi:hypothetical protein
MLEGPVLGGAAAFLLPARGLASPIRPGFVVVIPVKDEEERLPACLRALAPARSIRSADPASARARRRFRQIGGSISGSLKPHCPQALGTPAALVARRWTSPRLGSWKEAKRTA